MMQQLLVLLSTFLCVATSQAYPHPHRGKLRPFAVGLPSIRLDGAALSVLKQGEPYYTTFKTVAAHDGNSNERQEDDDVVRTMVVQDIHAPSDVVWDRILDFDAYSKMVPKTVESSIYKREHLSRNDKSIEQERISVRLQVGLPILHKKVQFHVKHLLDAPTNSMTWTLDYDHPSDIDDLVGYWYVIPHPDRPQHWTRVYHSVEIRMFSWVPKKITQKLVDPQAMLADATTWVKKYSEKHALRLLLT
jgi:hypothetical protein